MTNNASNKKKAKVKKVYPRHDWLIQTSESINYCKSTLTPLFINFGFPRRNVVRIDNRDIIYLDQALDFLLNLGISIEISGPGKYSKNSLYRYQVFDNLTGRNLTKRALYPVTRTFHGAVNVSAYLALSYLKAKGISSTVSKKSPYSQLLSPNIQATLHRMNPGKYFITNLDAIRFFQTDFGFEIGIYSPLNGLGGDGHYKWVVRISPKADNDHFEGGATNSLLDSISQVITTCLRLTKGYIKRASSNL